MIALPALDPGLRMGAVHLAVSDLGRSVDFYGRVLGLSVISSGQEGATLGGGPEHTLVELTRLAHPATLPAASTGLFHLALLHPDRRALADTLKRIVAARWPLHGAADHGVSEALYLDDPDGLGIEVYADRPRERWARTPDGAVEMYTAPLDIEDLVTQGAARPVAALDAQTVMGHIHLKVSDVRAPPPSIATPWAWTCRRTCPAPPSSAPAAITTTWASTRGRAARRRLPRRPRRGCACSSCS